MRTRLWGRVVPIVLAVVAAQAIAVVEASAASGTDVDSFDGVTLNDTDGAGREVPYVGGPRDFDSPAFDTGAFSLQAEELASGGGLHGCLTPSGPVYAGRTGWVRFDPGASGRIEVVAETPGYDSVLVVRSAADAAWGSTRLADAGTTVSCVDRVTDAGDEAVTGVAVTADRVYFVQVGGRCASGPETCQDANTPGGATRVRVRFTPDDSDGDGVADRQDNCEGQGAPGRVTSDGCPDADSDGVADAADSCPDLAGVPAAAPYNGCPDGLRPPTPGTEPSVTIQSRTTHDTYSTSTRNVDLLLNWPKGADSVAIRNGRGRTRVRDLARVVGWRLPGSKRPTVREVQVRFRGPRIADVVAVDTIVLDPTSPDVEASLVLESAQGWYVGVNLADSGTGVRSVRLLDEDKRPLDASEQVCSLDDCEGDVDLALTASSRRPAYIEVVDPSGNTTVVQLDRTSSASRCPGGEPIPYKSSYTRLECVELTQLCGSLKPLLIWSVSKVVRCRLVARTTFRVVPR
ncbi:hypothetical protein NOCD_06460 [Nocardioides cavernae]|uniref:hypothetical protein n=1 Tax=Nocardioides TaxID=1839 RepID=UPI0012E3C06E|nr:MULTISPECIES: hypothetical protein [Nocardioides]MCK9823118.1 hypothetical protein [Nocardioides cavernae]